jgi:hypothetical protein
LAAVLLSSGEAIKWSSFSFMFMIFAAKIRKKTHLSNTLKAFETIIKQNETYEAKYHITKA